MDSKSKAIYNKIENFLEERKGRDRRTVERTAPASVSKEEQNRRKEQDRRSRAK